MGCTADTASSHTLPERMHDLPASHTLARTRAFAVRTEKESEGCGAFALHWLVDAETKGGHKCVVSGRSMSGRR